MAMTTIRRRTRNEHRAMQNRALSYSYIPLCDRRSNLLVSDPRKQPAARQRASSTRSHDRISAASRERVDQTRRFLSSLVEFMLDPAHGGMGEPTSEHEGEARAAREWAVGSPQTATARCSPVERGTHDRSDYIIIEFENPVGRGLGQWVLQAPCSQQQTARLRRFHRGAGMLHFSDTLTRVVSVRYRGKKPPYHPLWLCPNS